MGSAAPSALSRLRLGNSQEAGQLHDGKCRIKVFVALLAKNQDFRAYYPSVLTIVFFNLVRLRQRKSLEHPFKAFIMSADIGLQCCKPLPAFSSWNHGFQSSFISCVCIWMQCETITSLMSTCSWYLLPLSSVVTEQRLWLTRRRCSNKYKQVHMLRQQRQGCRRTNSSVCVIMQPRRCPSANKRRTKSPRPGRHLNSLDALDQAVLGRFTLLPFCFCPAEVHTGRVL